MRDSLTMKSSRYTRSFIPADRSQDRRACPEYYRRTAGHNSCCRLCARPTEITGLSGFKIKESGKIKALTLELTKMGAKITETEDGLVIEGKEKLKGTVVDSGNNHSLAMALTVASLAATGETLIRKTQAVDIVYPEFFETFNKL